MLTKMMIRKYTAEDCQEYREDIQAELKRTATRIERLFATQAKNPGWAAYDKYADDIVGIDIRLDEQHAVGEMLEDDLLIIAERELVIKAKEAYPLETEKQAIISYKYQLKCDENEAKGLTRDGFTKKFDGESRTFYLNGVAITCSIDYDIAPHLEFRSVNEKEPNLISETGYRSHFTNVDQKQYDTMEESIEDAVEYIIRNKHMKNSKKPYTLTWEPSDEYLKESPLQLSFFGRKMKEEGNEACYQVRP